MTSVMNWGLQELLVLAIGGVILLSILILVLVIMPLQAYRRGHGFISWFVLQILAVNPIYPMLLVALLPNKARSRLRDQFAAELDQKLVRLAPAASSLPPIAGAIDRSLGDLPTEGERELSIGDRNTIE